MTVLEQLSLVTAETAVDEFTILVTGSRYHDNPGQIGTRLYEEIAKTDARTVVIRHGACPGGADLIVAEFCESEAGWFDNEGRVLAEDAMPADWDHCGADCPAGPHRKVKYPGDRWHPGLLDDYCTKSGPRRNQAMVDKGANVCLAFPHPRSMAGTAGCARKARRAGIRVEWVLHEPVAA